ncbi:hypothetical protein F8M41_022227 [Gigaspora margarita]|uniref:Uncharacterized protein n=1 Tax=Gigaspora margarita TaxID=4874 RepID=A0A8H4B1A6_GIGMA|nr:hypothetical protein F8M41_022227 [Gigaspora margarita]
MSIYSSFLICASTLKSFLSQLSNNILASIVDKFYKLITKYLNRISGHAKFTSPQVSAYLLDIHNYYIPNKFVTIYLHSFKTYPTNEWTKYTQNIAENINELNNNLDADSEQDAPDESFIISSFDGKLTTANLHIDYQYRGLSLRNICLNDLTNNYIYNTDSVHSQNKTYIQRIKRKETERIVILSGKGIPKIDDIENADCYVLCILMLFKLWKTV